MKKLSLLLAGMLASLAFVSCEDTEPRAEVPTDNNFLNTPPTAENFVYDLESMETVNLTCSQPDYGVAVIPTYAVQVSLSPDFSTLPEDKWIFNKENAVPYAEIPFTSTQADMDVPASDIAQGISTVLGYKKITEYEGRTPYSGPIYVRLRAYFPTLENDTYTVLSNVIKLNVVGYATVREPGTLWLIGTPTNWAAPDAASAETLSDWRLRESEDEIGSQTYYATFEIPAGTLTFKFYSKLTGWDGGDAWGYTANDGDNEISLDAEGVYDGTIVKGKGNYMISSWDGGYLSFTVDLKNGKVKFVKVEAPE